MSNTAPEFCIVGLSNRPDFTPTDEVRRALSTHSIFCGSERHHEIVARWLPNGHLWLALHTACALLASADKFGQPIVVFASGDPLFYGIASALCTAAPNARVRTLPWFTNFQLLCHRLALSYTELVATSTHGRDWTELDAALIRGERLIGVFTDTEHSPAAIARRLLDYGFGHYALHVGEALESSAERIRTLTLEQAATETFNPLNSVILIADKRQPPTLGLDEALLSGLPDRPDMVTKMPVRLASLARLDLARRHCLWDVGFCTGSVSIEARRQNPHLRVVAFEKRSECAELLAHNARTFGAPGIVAVMGDFFNQPLADFPAPDAVFIGGHGGRLADLVNRLDSVLTPGGRLVINAVLDTSHSDFVDAVTRLRYNTLPSLRLQVDDHNPIVVLGAVKPVGTRFKENLR